MSCQPLNQSTVHRIRSPYIINDVIQIIDELISNSIDADSTHIHMQYNSINQSIIIIDNGIGIMYTDMVNVGQRYYTSKCNDIEQLHNGINTLGYRGEALSSISELCCVTIQSHAQYQYYSMQQCNNTYSKTIEYGQHSDVQLLPRDAVPNELHQHGTMITVSNIFNNNTIRNNTMKNNIYRYSNKLQQLVQQISLIHPTIQFELIDSNTHKLILHKPITSTIQQSFQLLYHQQLADKLLHIPLINTKHKKSQQKSNYQVTGYLCELTSFHTTSQLQFLYVNHRIVHHKHIMKLLQQMYDRCYKVVSTESIDIIDKTHKQYNKSIIYPYYIINIECAPSLFDILFDTNKRNIQFSECERLMNYIQSIYKQWLFHYYPYLQSQERYLFPNKHNRHNNIRLAYIDHAESIDQPYNTGITTNNSLLHPMFTDKRYQLCRTARLYAAPKHSLASLLPADYNPYNEIQQRINKRQRRYSAIDQPIDVTHNNNSSVSLMEATTKMHCYCNKCIISSYHAQIHCQCCVCIAHDHTSNTDMHKHQVQTSNHQLTTITNTASLNTQSTLDIIANQIHTISNTTNQQCSNGQQNALLSSECEINQGRFMTNDNDVVQLTRNDLDKFTLLSQVDNKYIVGMIDNVIVGIDQHAADERIQYEHIINNIHDYMSAHILSTAQQLYLTSTEVNVIQHYAEFLLYWGFALQQCNDNQAYVNSLPRILDTVLTIRDLQDYIAELSVNQSTQQRIPNCILRVVASKSCRTAIKFGDKISNDDMLDIIQQLKRTTTPFCCAHGRPTCNILYVTDDIDDCPTVDQQYVLNVSQLLKNAF